MIGGLSYCLATHCGRDTVGGSTTRDKRQNAVHTPAHGRRPCYTVSITEFFDEKLARETQYFGDPFKQRPSRSQWVQRMP